MIPTSRDGADTPADISRDRSRSIVDCGYSMDVSIVMMMTSFNASRGSLQIYFWNLSPVLNLVCIT